MGAQLLDQSGTHIQSVVLLSLLLFSFRVNYVGPYQTHPIQPAYRNAIAADSTVREKTDMPRHSFVKKLYPKQQLCMEHLLFLHFLFVVANLPVADMEGEMGDLCERQSLISHRDWSMVRLLLLSVCSSC